ncbi:keratin-associated protein 15-1 [Erinaceus europaeus]|uniref:Keratin-associated protein n=1 Tax=Erinaceus europaeus TaxID=9365 RepID=A0A1S3A379_ERIEU|nr:keratin-associated protein 15-1 [Erinaceus europaeus]
MSYNYSSGNFSSRTFGGYLGCPASTSETVFPNNVVYSSGAYQLGSPLYADFQETFNEPAECQNSCTVTRPFPRSCYRQKNFFLSNPCQTNYTGSLGYGNVGFGSFGYGNTGFQSQGCGSTFYRPAYFSSKHWQSSCYQPAFGNRFYGSTY